MKERILLFSTYELIHLYGSISKYIEKDFEVIHLAYSNKEEKLLKEKYRISNPINFKNEIDVLYSSEKIDNELLWEIDKFIIKNSTNRFCLNSAIQSDRSFQYLPYEECLKLTQVYYKFWDLLIKNNNIKYIIHEPNAILFTQMASLIAKKYNSLYLTQIQVFGENKTNWIFVDGDKGFPVELSLISEIKTRSIDVKRIEKFLLDFRSNQNGLLEALSKEKKTVKITHIFFSFLRLFARHLKRGFLRINKKSFNIQNHVEAYLVKSRKSFKDDFFDKWNYLISMKYDSFSTDDVYYYYPLHLEPEAVVLYWADGIYKNQVKLIENIAAQLPPCCYLYVKDHPHGGDYREHIDYKRIKAIPNVKLLSPNASGKVLIANSRGVITINGTSGFEALLLNKQIYTFGNSFYDLCNRVKKINHIKDLRSHIYDNYMNIYTDDSELYSFIDSYLKSSHEGFTAYFLDYAKKLNIDIKSNAILVADGMLNSLENVSRFKKVEID